MTAAARTGTALRDAARGLRGGWRGRHTLVLAALVPVALAPAAAPAWMHVDALASGFYLALAATGLWLAVGLAGLPSLGQGAFMAIGAVTVALLTARAGWPALAAVVVGVAAAALGGIVTGAGVIRLRPAFVAVTTWILTWATALVLAAFPSLLGGSRGVVVPQALSVTAHYELALVLLVAAVLAAAAVAGGAVGIELRAARQRPAAAAALGVATARRRLGAFVAAAAVAGLAGGLAVQLAGVADAGDYGPYLSFRLLVAVVIGGVASALGPTVGIAALAVVTAAAGALGTLEGVATERFEPMLSAALLLAVLALGGEGIVPELRRLVSRPTRRREPEPAGSAMPLQRAAAPAAPLLVAEGLTKRFGAVTAADGVDVGVAGGEICALVGPNGSGKTTVLRLLGGTLRPDAGRVLLGGDDLTDLPPRGRALRGVVRTLQSTAAFADLTALENVLVGAGLRRVHGGALRTAAATPLARAEAATVRAAARAALEDVGLGWAEGVPAGALPGADQRLLGIAAALATGPRVLLLDEPAAGASHADIVRIAALLSRLADRGIAILVVEHNLRLVRSIADRVLVLAGGAVIASGSADGVAADPAVREAYLGRAAL
jgi:ABC-type branched-subunit amino acid transport system ATPase component/ABC-type branched-subunit amino acid transport system permease subunit